MNTLYIIGNGFDLHFGLKTKPSDFTNYLKKQHVFSEVENALDIINSYGVDWCEYEQSLNNIDLDEIFYHKTIFPDYLSDRESDRDNGILNMHMYVDSLKSVINSALTQMIEDADNDIYMLKKRYPLKKLFDCSDSLLSFNYTSTVEELFYLPNDISIFHIHGYLAQKEKLIFGYKKKLQKFSNSCLSTEEDYYINCQRESVLNFYKGLEKDFQFNSLRSFLQDCHRIYKIVVLGHSMGDVDKEYMELIDQIVNPYSWEITCYNKNDSNRIKDQKYSFQSKIKFIEFPTL